jgi:Starch-binding associating with outer membrane
MLRLNINNKLLLAGCFLLGMISCKKQLDVNLDNPNGVTINQLSGKDVFAYALQNTSTNITNNFAFANEWMGYWARTTSYSASGNQALIERFNLNNGYSDAIWQPEYHNIYDYNFVIGHSTANSVLPGASMVMKALIFQDLVDMFGNVPYSQAGDPNISISPTYDDAQSIYKNLIGQLDKAITSLKAAQATNDNAADIMFHGDKAKWVRFANTLKLRILMRQVPKGDMNYVKSEIDKIASEGSGFLQAGEDAVIQPGYADQVSKQNPFWSVYGFEVGGTSPKAGNILYIANKTMLDMLSATNDPRIAYLYDTTGGRHTGNYLGDFANARPTAQLATIGNGILRSASMPGVIMPAFESFFLQAEAVQRGLLTSSSTYQQLYHQGVIEDFHFLGFNDPTGAATSYLAASPNDARVDINAGNPLESILYQKWIALAETDGLEAWSEWRRTHYPDRTNPSVAAGVNRNEIPERLLYPQSEYNLNSTNVNAQRQTIADLYTPIFWAQ